VAYSGELGMFDLDSQAVLVAMTNWRMIRSAPSPLAATDASATECQEFCGVPLLTARRLPHIKPPTNNYSDVAKFSKLIDLEGIAVNTQPHIPQAKPTRCLRKSLISRRYGIIELAFLVLEEPANTSQFIEICRRKDASCMFFDEMISPPTMRNEKVCH